MRIITCASYYATGSSAVTHMFSECDLIKSLGEYEYRFLQEPNGISDLQYNVVENNHRHNTSDAIKRYMKYCKDLKRMGYGGYDVFKGHFIEISKEYIDSITELKAHSWWNKDRTDRGIIFCYIDRGYSLIRRMLSKKLKQERWYSLLNGKEYGYYTNISEEDFLSCTRKYVDKLICSAFDEIPSFVMVDQMVPPSNLPRYLNYFNDVKVIVVDRDPRDIYLAEKYIYQYGIIPVETPEIFAKWFELTRRPTQRPENDDLERVLRIRFEDMIYKYDEMEKKLFEFVGLPIDQHTRKRTIFDPSISIKNTNLVRRFPEGMEDADRIAQLLPEYLYAFPVSN